MEMILINEAAITIDNNCYKKTYISTCKVCCKVKVCEVNVYKLVVLSKTKIFIRGSFKKGVKMTCLKIVFVDKPSIIDNPDTKIESADDQMYNVQ